MKVHPHWLPYFQQDIVMAAGGKVGNRLLFALEGWWRGLSVTLYRKKVLLSSGDRKHYVTGRVDLVSKEAGKICRDKDATKQYLAKAGIPCPQGKKFAPCCSEKELIKYAAALGFPVVIKPADGCLGRGVIANIADEKTLKRVIKDFRKQYGERYLILEKHFHGDDYRVLVLGDKILGVIKRIPANVIGNGKDTIETLIRLKNEVRKENPYLAKGLIKIDNEVKACLAQQGYKLKSRPPQGEHVYLRTKCNLSAGGDSIDATDDVPQFVKEMAVRAAQAIPGLLIGGVDLLVNEKEGTACVIEINGAPQLAMHLFPMYGQARDVVGEILDYMFPETASRPRGGSLVIDWAAMQKVLDSGAVSHIALRPYPQGELKAIKLNVSGKIQGVGFRRWVQNTALSLNLSGHAKNLANGDVEIIAAGNADDVEALAAAIRETKKFGKIKVTQSSWDHPIKAGFVRI